VTDGVEVTRGATARRSLLKVVAGSAGLAAVALTTRQLARPEEEDTASGGLVLSTHGRSDVQSLHVRMDDRYLTRVGPERWESAQLPTSTHSMIGFIWAAGERDPQVDVRSRLGGTWGPWGRLPPLHDVPEPASGAKTWGTDLAWIGRADGVQVRVRGPRPKGLTLVLLHPERRAADPLAGLGASALGRRAAQNTPTTVARPALLSRRQWGADETLRDGEPAYIHTIKQVHVHHTVNSNTYAREDVPALLRGMYAYHTRTLGWSDIGYNFLVDRFGQCWVGRAGGAARLVRGGHTLGFNGESTGISAIGNYDTRRPPSVMLDAIAAIAAWKLEPFERDPEGRVRVESEGSDNYESGLRVRLPVIDGHRDTNDTACPGQHLYEALPEVRRRAAALLAARPQSAVVVTQPAVVVGTPHLGNVLTLEPGAFAPPEATATFRWLRDGAPIWRAQQQTYRVRPRDVGRTLACEVTLHHPGLQPAIQVVPTTGAATAQPTLSVRATSTDRAVRIRLTVASPTGVRLRPTGRITVTVGEAMRSLDVVEGEARVRFAGRRRPSSGRHPLRVVYGGDTTFTPVTKDRTVRVS
jgi:hypothetical protein